MQRVFTPCSLKLCVEAGSEPDSHPCIPGPLAQIYSRVPAILLLSKALIGSQALKTKPGLTRQAQTTASTYQIYRSRHTCMPHEPPYPGT